MQDHPTQAAVRPQVQAEALARFERRLLPSAAQGRAPWLHQEMARRMDERLGWVRQQPRQVLDWSSLTGAGATLLRQRYPHAEIWAEEDAATRAWLERQPVMPWWSPRRWRSAAPALRLPLRTEHPSPVELVWSNAYLHRVQAPQAVLSAWHHALAQDGFLMFSTFGPGHLPELSEIYAEKGWGPAFAPMVDMHDLGDMLVQVGFADPVMDQETLTLTWADPQAALNELRSVGSNVHAERFAGCRGRHWRDALCQALHDRAALRRDGRVALTFELVWGHAVKPAPRFKVAAETRIGVEALRAQARTRREAM